MEKVLGVDLGTDSIGWAIVQRHDTRYELLDRGVDIFQEGVARGDTGQEQPAVQQRTAARALRRHYARRRLRKIELLKVLVRHELCPPLTEEQLEEWKRRKVYPLTDEFLRWQRTDDRTDRNPYRDRYRALTETLDLATQHDRYALGRAFYHLAQRRGFRSNRKEAGADREEGKVKGAIRELSAEIADAGCAYAGIYFYELYRRGERIRTRYTSRTEHQLAEFEAICARQRLPDELCGALRRAIFFQRPLKSQKGLVGRCTFEKRKSRCAASHPRFEEFRMRSYVNNIRIETPADPAPRPLYPEEIEAIAPLFQRKSRPHFDFEDIAKKLAGKGRYACKGDRIEAPYRFNFARKATVSGSPVTAALAGLFGDDWLRELCRRYALGAGKSEERILDDVWHALFSFDDDERLRAWAKERLGLDDDEAARFAAIRLPQGYAALSLNAIRKILPALRAGYRYDDAVFIANLKAVLPPAIRADEAQRSAIEADIAALLDDYRSNPLNRATKEECIRDYLRDRIGSDESRLRRLYHPSMIETYPAARPDAQGSIRLGSPRTPAVRNPMAMRALHRLRALVNARCSATERSIPARRSASSAPGSSTTPTGARRSKATSASAKPNTGNTPTRSAPSSPKRRAAPSNPRRRMCSNTACGRSRSISVSTRGGRSASPTSSATLPGSTSNTRCPARAAATTHRRTRPCAKAGSTAKPNGPNSLRSSPTMRRSRHGSRRSAGPSESSSSARSSNSNTERADRRRPSRRRMRPSSGATACGWSSTTGNRSSNASG